MPNSIAAALTPDFLEKQVVIPLQSQLAPLNAFATQFEPDPIKPLATVQFKLVVSGGTTQTDPTDFRTGGDSVINAGGVTMHQLTHPWHLTNQELQSGIRLEDLFQINVNKFAQTLMRTVTAPITTANFPAAPLISAAAAFSVGDMDALWAAICKSKVKNLILSGPYFVRIQNKPGFFQQTGTAPGEAWKPFGWSWIGQNDEWGAETGTVGFACHPQAIGVVLGLPIQFPAPNMMTTVLPLPGIGAKALLNCWMDLDTRTTYCTLDVMLGTRLLDGTAGVLVKSQ